MTEPFLPNTILFIPKLPVEKEVESAAAWVEGVCASAASVHQRHLKKELHVQKTRHGIKPAALLLVLLVVELAAVVVVAAAATLAAWGAFSNQL
jgi:hypothetical protein